MLYFPGLLPVCVVFSLTGAAGSSCTCGQVEISHQPDGQTPAQPGNITSAHDYFSRMLCARVFVAFVNRFLVRAKYGDYLCAKSVLQTPQNLSRKRGGKKRGPNSFVPRQMLGLTVGRIKSCIKAILLIFLDKVVSHGKLWNSKIS